MKKKQLFDVLDIIKKFKCLKFFGIIIKIDKDEILKVFSMENIDSVRKSINSLYDISLEHKHVSGIYITKIAAGEHKDEVYLQLNRKEDCICTT